jgi:predicted metal-dependent hydrolase
MSAWYTGQAHVSAIVMAVMTTELPQQYDREPERFEFETEAGFKFKINIPRHHDRDARNAALDLRDAWLNEIVRDMLEQNAKSLQANYPEKWWQLVDDDHLKTVDGVKVFDRSRVVFEIAFGFYKTKDDRAKALQLLDSYEYQSGDDDAWDRSFVRLQCARMRAHLLAGQVSLGVRKSGPWSVAA